MDPGDVLRVLIVDDEPLAVERNAQLCRQIKRVEVVGTLTASRQVPAAVVVSRPDLVLLDISMPGLDGLALGRMLAAVPDGPALVFATAHNDFAVAAFELAATDYLLKPVAPERLHEAIERVRSARRRRWAERAAHLDAVWVPHGAQMVRLAIGSLELVEAERDYVRLHANGRSFLLRGTIGDLERRLDPARFVRVHRSAIVPIDRIRAIGGAAGAWTLELSSGRRVPVGRSFRAGLRRLIAGPTAS